MSDMVCGIVFESEKMFDKAYDTLTPYSVGLRHCFHRGHGVEYFVFFFAYPKYTLEDMLIYTIIHGSDHTFVGLDELEKITNISLDRPNNAITCETRCHQDYQHILGHGE